MKKITEEEINKLTIIHDKRAKSSFIEECFRLEIGEKLFISREEWEKFGYTKKTTPAILICSAIRQTRKNHRSRLTGMKFETQKYQEGWVVKKLKS